MVIFFDTSSLFKRYTDEAGSVLVDKYFTDENDIVVSPVTRLEFYSAITRREKDKSINLEDVLSAIREFHIDLAGFRVVPLSPELEEKAAEMIRIYQGKPLDCIQLASAKLSNADIFITSDHQLYDRSKKELICETIFI